LIQKATNKGVNTMKTIKTILLIFLAILINSTITYAFKLPDTGQNKCYDNKKEIPCPKPGEDFYGQDGNYLINPPSMSHHNN